MFIKEFNFNLIDPKTFKSEGTYIYIDSPLELPANKTQKNETEIQLRGWIISNKEIKNAWLSSGKALQMLERHDVRDVLPQFPYIKGFFTTLSEDIVKKEAKSNQEKTNIPLIISRKYPLTIYFNIGEDCLSYTVLFKDFIDFNRKISSKDNMYTGDNARYFSVGRSALECIHLAMINAGKTDAKNILDLPCGYGRVLRTLRYAFPHAKITACDIESAGVDFCVKTFDAHGVYSNKNPKNISLKNKFDLIWCGSLLTHLDKKGWIDFIHLFNRLLIEKGILVFTTHGRMSVNNIRKGIDSYNFPKAKLSQLIESVEQTGFGYINYKNINNYGISISLPSWVLSLIEDINGLRVVSLTERGWDKHQDVIVCIKDIDYS